MRLLCFSCGKSVTNELPNDTILRAIATCPECLLKDTDDALQQQVAELQEQHEKDIEFFDECMRQYDIQQERACNAEQERDALKAKLAEANEDAERLAKDSIIWGATKECRYCHNWEAGVGSIKHTDDCPYVLHIARLAKDES